MIGGRRASYGIDTITRDIGDILPTYRNRLDASSAITGIVARGGNASRSA